MWRNDCLPVIFALRKGSASPVMKKAAEDTCKKALEAGCRLVYLHVPGVQLIAEQIDGGSREGALRLAGPACTRRTRSEISSLLQPHGWVVTFDLFTAQSNVLVDRFASWTDEPQIVVHYAQLESVYVRVWPGASRDELHISAAGFGAGGGQAGEV